MTQQTEPMESNEVKGKYEAELKWGSYYFILTFGSTALFTLIQFLFWPHNYADAVVGSSINILLLIYFSILCIKEKSTSDRVSFVSKALIYLRILVVKTIFVVLVISTHTAFIRPRNDFNVVDVEDNWIE
jgi:hypothetical protein